jgi:hypothetical protein
LCLLKPLSLLSLCDCHTDSVSKHERHMGLPSRRSWQASAGIHVKHNAVINQGSRLALDLEGPRKGTYTDTAPWVRVVSG